MIEAVITYINDKIKSDLGYYKNYHGLCELIKRDNIIFPAEYCNKEYKELEIEKPIIYHRVTSALGIDYIEDEETSINDEYEVRTYTIRLVSITDKNIFNKKNNDAYINSKLQNNLLSLLATKQNKTLAKSLGVDVVSIVPSSSSFLREQWTQEYNGSKELNHNYCIITIDYDVVISASSKCFVKYGC